MAAAPGGVHGFVPALTSFVGRADDARKLDGLLGEYRLVTVTGPGGVGKTRLACEVARRAGARFADGVWLAAVQDPALVPAAIAAVMGIPQSPGSSLTQTLAGALSRRQLLLVLDNCEHVLGAVAELCGCLLPAADDVTVLATSREPIGIAGETRYRLGPLPVPGAGPAGRGPGSAAVQLFAEASEDQDTAAALSRYAIKAAESAAAGLQTSTGELAAVRWLDAETSTVEQALAWSLEHDHATAVRLAAALGPWWILRGRVAEAERNLRAAAVSAEPGSHIWCRLQLLLGEFAEYSSLENAVAHYVAVCDAAGGGPSPILAAALNRRAHSLVNLGRLDEGAELARAGLAMSRDLGYLAGVATSLAALGGAAFHVGRSDEALSWYRQACQVDQAGISGSLSRECGLLLTNALRRVGDGEAALRTCADTLSRAIAADDVEAQVGAHILMADLERQTGRLAAGAAHLGESLRLSRLTGSLFRLSDSLEICGHLCADRGRWADAVSVWSAATALLRASGLSDTPLDLDARRVPWQKAAQVLGPAQMRAAEERGAGMAAEAAGEFVLVLTIDDPQPAPEQNEMPQLSARERELVTLVAQGRTDTQIAGQLYIAVSTVRSHLDRIRDKTGSRRRADLTRMALQAGLI